AQGDRLAAAARAGTADAWYAVFFTDKGTPRAGGGVTKAIHAAFPTLQAAFDAEAERLAGLVDRRNAVAALEITAALLR
ncbi:hypothetical protein J8J27_34795, partial [Mycobacterium tuberculosis]|nr:hypothetical protein [Mycobacterium tuberculosis]